MSTISTSQSTIGQMMLMRRGGAVSYTQKVLGIQSANLIAYWPLSETSGTAADNAEGTAARDGTYSNVTLANSTFPNGDNAALFVPGSSSYIDIYSTSLRDAYNAELATIALQFKVRVASVWTDGVGRRLFTLQSDGSNYINVAKASAANRIAIERLAGGAVEVHNEDSFSSTDWVKLVITIDAANDRIRYYINGSLVDTDTGLGVYANLLAATTTVIGANSTTPAASFDGWIGRVGIWDIEWTQADVDSYGSE